VKSFLLITFLALSVSAPGSRAQSVSSAPKTEAADASKSEAARQQPAAQDLSSHVPAPRPDDVNSLDAILKAIYDVISGPAGERDWNRFRSLFVPEARLTSATQKNGGPVRLLDVEGYARGAGSYFKTHAFYESAITNRVQMKSPSPAASTASSFSTTAPAGGSSASFGTKNPPPIRYRQISLRKPND